MSLQHKIGTDEKPVADELVLFLQNFSVEEHREMCFFLQGMRVAKDLMSKEEKEERQ